MLEVKEVSLQVASADQTLLHEVSVRFPKKHFAAILGPSGCGKSTLLKTIAGLFEPTLGSLFWKSRDLVEDADFDPHEIGYVPQFGIAYELLTVWENLDAALKLRVAGLSAEERDERIEKILASIGLTDIADRQVRLLSGGQKRRLALALELTAQPHLLLCDEVTSGLDPKSEDEIVHLMRDLAHNEERIVLSVTHSLRHLALYDSVVVLYAGRVAYHGRPDELLHYFNVENADDLYPRLTERDMEKWHQSWIKNRPAYYAEHHLDAPYFPDEKPEGAEEDERLPFPSAFAQFFTLVARRMRLFFRDRGALLLQLALLFGFPIVVVLFALDGLPAVKSLADSGGNLFQQITEQTDAIKQRTLVGALVSGLIMFQVVLLSVTGSNNGAREIAGERLIFEKEKFAGLSPGAYVASKAFFLGLLVVAQSVWMAVFVNMIVRFPGSLAAQAILLTLVNGAITSVCLGLSAIMRTPEQANITSIYLVGFQLPLSGAVLALPKALSAFTQPLIASYWGWSGFIHTMRDTRFYEPMLSITQTKIVGADVCGLVLMAHIIAGLFLAWFGCKASRWE